MAKSSSGKSKTAVKNGANARKNGSFKISSEPVVHGKTEGDVHKYEVTRGEAPTPAFEDLGELPQTYGADHLYLIARDPHWLFTYWDVNWSAYSAAKMRGGEFRVYLKVATAKGKDES